MDTSLPATADLAETRLSFLSMLGINALALLAVPIAALIANISLFMTRLDFVWPIWCLFAGGLAMVFIQDKLVKPRLSRGRRWALYLIGGMLVPAWVLAVFALKERLIAYRGSAPISILVEMMGYAVARIAFYLGITLPLTGFLGIFSAMLMGIHEQRRWWVLSLMISTVVLDFLLLAVGGL